MTETIYESARRRLPELEADAEKLAERLKAIKAEIGDLRPLVAKVAAQSQSTPEGGYSKLNAAQSTPSPRQRGRRAGIAAMVRMAALTAAGDARQDKIIGAVVNGAMAERSGE